MNKTHALTSRRLLLPLAALCLCAGAAARPAKERAKEFRPDAAQRGETEDAGLLREPVRNPAAVTLLPFYVDPAQDFNEWLVEFLPPARRE